LDYNADPTVAENSYQFLTATQVNTTPNTVLSRPSELKELLMSHIGASRPKTDAVDFRYLDDIKDGTGQIINSPSEKAPYPTYSGSWSLIDTEEDGMSHGNG
jgi:hypothetical protein